jgi:hypothetical protein
MNREAAAFSTPALADFPPLQRAPTAREVLEGDELMSQGVDTLLATAKPDVQ